MLIQKLLKAALLGLFLSFITIDSVSAQDLIPVLLNEKFNEWEMVEDISKTLDVDNLSIKALNTSEYFFLYFELSEEISIQNSERIILYLDTDGDAETGKSFHGIGAELEVNFGVRSVTTRIDGRTDVVGFKDIELNIMPTVWSDKFEIAIARDSEIFSSNELKVVVENVATQELSPLSPGGAAYSFKEYQFSDLPSYSVSKIEGTHLRMMSHNVLRDDLFEGSKKANFRRMYEVIKPDIIGFQEIYDHSASDVAELMEELLPTSEKQTWFASKVHDNIVASRYPVLSKHQANVGGNGAFLLDLRPDYNTPLLIINAHTPCCANDDGRKYEIDAMMAFIRDAKSGVGSLSLAENTPIVVMGDMNLVGDPQNILTLLDGDIQNESTWGSDFTPDWDGNDFLDAEPIVAGLPMTFTHWSYPGSGSYSTGRLDAIMYSGSGLTLENAYVLNTEFLSVEELTMYDLREGDSQGASDHLPLVADFRVTAVVEQESVLAAPQLPLELDVEFWPNPAQDILMIEVKTSTVEGQLTILDLSGRILLIKEVEQAEPTFKLDISSFESGIYTCSIKLKDGQITKKIVVQ